MMHGQKKHQIASLYIGTT